MSQDMVLFQDEQANANMEISTLFANQDVDGNDDLADGIGGSYAILSMKGSRLQVKYQGTTTIITGPTGDPVGSLEAVIVKGNKNITKQYYSKGYTEGDTSAPDCFSLDGKVPAESVPQPQHTNCAACKMNQFGSRINPTTGVKSKACADNRKLAVVPLADLRNELLGGPMLLRVPATALKDLAMFADTLKARGYPYNSVAVRIGFDLSVSYPKPTFKAIRPLTDEEAQVVLEWVNSEQVEKVLADFAPAEAAEAAPVDSVFEQPPPPAEPPQAAKPKVATQPPPPVAKPAAPKAAAPAAMKPAAPVATQSKAPAVAPKPAPAKAAAPKPVAAKPAPEPTGPEDEVVDNTTEVVPSNLENDIASILADLNSIPSE